MEPLVEIFQSLLSNRALFQRSIHAVDDPKGNTLRSLQPRILDKLARRNSSSPRDNGLCMEMNQLSLDHIK
jgi:hypothetical protein